MNYNTCTRSTKIQSLCILFCALTLSCCASLVYASELDRSSNSHTRNVNSYEDIRKSAISGSAESQFELGLLFEYGRGVDQDDLEAAYWYGKSAHQGYSNAQYRLAVLFDNGWGHPVDKKKAKGLYESAAERGHELAQYALAIMYFEGAGVDRSLVQAYKWLRIADMNGNPLMQKHLHRVSEEMSSDEIKVAEYLANQWTGHPGI